VLLVFGLRIIVRRKAHLTFRSARTGKADMHLNLTNGPALLWGAALLVLGLRIVGAFTLAWLRGEDFAALSFGGSVTIWALIGLVVAVAWHLVNKARTAIESPEIQDKIARKIEQARDENDKN
jgi:hypothetical protein